MKKTALNGYIVMWMFLPLLVLAHPLSAEETGPTGEYKGFFQVEIKASGLNRDIIEDLGGGRRDQFSVYSTRFFAQVSIKPLSLLEVYVLGGAANLRITNVSVNRFYGRLGPYYGAGLRITLYESPVRRTLSIFLNGSISQITSKETGALKTFMDTVENMYRVDEEITWREYGVMVGGRGRFTFPGAPEGYAGLMISRVEGKDTFSAPISRTYSVEELGLLSIILGADFYLDPKEIAAINVELGLGDPLYIMGGVKLWF